MHGIFLNYTYYITAAGVVPCGGPKKSLRTSSIVQIIFNLYLGLLRVVKIFRVFKTITFRNILLSYFFYGLSVLLKQESLSSYS